MAGKAKTAGGLTPNMEMFAVGLASGLSQAEAYRKAYPKSLKWSDKTVWEQASVLAKNNKVSTRVAELLAKSCEKNEITIDKIVAELAKMAFFDVRKLFNGDGSPKSIQDLDDDTAAAVAGIDVANVGNSEIGVGQVLKLKLADKKANLELLGKWKGMFPTNVNLGGQKDNPVELKQQTRIVIVPIKETATVLQRAMDEEQEADDE